MCQLLGMNCATPTDITFSFRGFSQRAGVTSDHCDGFGIAFFEDKACRLFVDNQSAVESPIADLVRNYPIKSRNVIAHIRKATQGKITLENSHPFLRELWGGIGFLRITVIYTILILSLVVALNLSVIQTANVLFVIY
jgi:glutamine amidotransferase